VFSPDIFKEKTVVFLIVPVSHHVPCQVGQIPFAKLQPKTFFFLPPNAPAYL
jgi:hypothetical protein